MIAEMTNEQVVTNLLVSNQILKPICGFSGVSHSADLGAYLSNLPDDNEPQNQPKCNGRYAFINI